MSVRKWDDIIRMRAEAIGVIGHSHGVPDFLLLNSFSSNKILWKKVSGRISVNTTACLRRNQVLPATVTRARVLPEELKMHIMF